MIFRSVSPPSSPAQAEAPTLAEATLVLLTGERAGRIWPIGGELIIGRGDDATAVVTDTQVSRHHARLLFDGLVCRVQDLGSVNGTFLNEERLADSTPRELRHGDQLRLGPFTCLQFRLLVHAAQVGRRLSEVFRQLQTAMTELEVLRNAAPPPASSVQAARPDELLTQVRTEIAKTLRFVSTHLEFAITELPRLKGEPVRSAEMRHAVTEALLGVEQVRRLLGDPALKPPTETPEELEVIPLVESALAACLAATGSRAKIVKELGPPQVVRGHATRLGDVFLQLLLEAATAVAQLPADRAAISVRSRLSRNAVAIEIQDTGPGHTPEELEALFAQTPPVQPASGGPGLSFARCREIVVASNGELRMLSEKGRGSFVQVVLRMAKRTESHSVDVTNPAVQLRRGRLLFIPGEPAVAELVGRLRGEHDVTTLPTASEALLALRGGPSFDLVVVDLAGHSQGTQLHDRVVQEMGSRAPRFIFLLPDLMTPDVTIFLARAHGDPIPRPVDVSRLRALVRARLI